MLPSGSIPLFFLQNNPLYRRCPAVILSAEYPPVPLRLRHRLPVSTRLASFCQACQFLPGCESFNKLALLPAGNTHAGHTTRAGKDSHSIMIVIIIIISIR